MPSLKRSAMYKRVLKLVHPDKLQGVGTEEKLIAQRAFSALVTAQRKQKAKSSKKNKKSGKGQRPQRR